MAMASARTAMLAPASEPGTPAGWTAVATSAAAGASGDSAASTLPAPSAMAMASARTAMLAPPSEPGTLAGWTTVATFAAAGASGDSAAEPLLLGRFAVLLVSIAGAEPRLSTATGVAPPLALALSALVLPCAWAAERLRFREERATRATFARLPIRADQPGLRCDDCCGQTASAGSCGAPLAPASASTAAVSGWRRACGELVVCSSRAGAATSLGAARFVAAGATAAIPAERDGAEVCRALSGVPEGRPTGAVLFAASLCCSATSA
mmetsp:Transcript_14811/g.47332  ORF Transcript_14811/g.47332 Transcript_14811/m.47332 type:complete len:267 (+) Transcript_14811:549-1349(+)